MAVVAPDVADDIVDWMSEKLKKGAQNIQMQRARRRNARQQRAMLMVCKLALVSLFPGSFLVSWQPLEVHRQAACSMQGCSGPNGSRTRRRGDTLEDAEQEKTCVICMAAPKEWSFRHGHSVHVCACEHCAKMCFKERRICPVCNMPADEILQVFSA